MQRAIEEAGIPTIIIAALPPVVRQTGTPRAVAPLVPMGANAGGPHNVEQQTQIVKVEGKDGKKAPQRTQHNEMSNRKIAEEIAI